MSPDAILVFSAKGAFYVLILALLCAVIRLVRGPSLPDRVVALDLTAVIVAALTAVNALATGKHLFLLPAIALSLIGFVGTVAYAIYIGKGGEE